jgi:hypothetical protein
MLKDLQSSLSKRHIAVSQGSADKTQIITGTTKDTSIHNETHRESIDTGIACDIVGRIFRSIDMCLEEDRSKVKLSLFTKSFIKGILTGTVRTGIDDFIKNMNNRDIRSLLDNIQEELDKRK